MKVLEENIAQFEETKAISTIRKKYVIWAMIFIVACLSVPKLADTEIQIHLYSGCTSTSCVNHRYYWTFPGTSWQICMPC